MKIIEEDKYGWHETLCSWTGRINLLRKEHVFQGHLQMQCNSCLITAGLFHRIGTGVCMQTQKTLTSRASLEKEE